MHSHVHTYMHKPMLTHVSHIPTHLHMEKQNIYTCLNTYTCTDTYIYMQTEVHICTHTHTHTHTHTLQFLAFMALFMLSPLSGMPCPHCGLANPTHTSRLISEATFFRKTFFGLDFPLCSCSYPELISIMLCCAVLCSVASVMFNSLQLHGQ